MKDYNPLLHAFGTPYQSTPFDKILPAHFEPAIKTRIRNLYKVFKRITESTDNPSFENTIGILEPASEALNRLELLLYNLNSAETNDEIQKVSQKVSPLLTKQASTILIDEKYFEKISQLYGQIETLNLGAEQKRLLELTYRNMKRNGASLSSTKKAKLIKLQMRLAKISLKFNNNVLDATNAYKLHITSPNDLQGLPQNAIDTAKTEAQNKNIEGWIFTLQFPSYSAFMKFADNRKLREQMYRAFTSRCFSAGANNNIKLVEQIVTIRFQLAQLLGYENFAHYVLEERMANTPQKVNDFVAQLQDASRSKALDEIKELDEFAKENGLTEKLMPWDFNYFSEKLKTSKFGFKEEELKAYFKLESVLQGVFDLATKLYGLQFSEITNIPVYHIDVKTYEVRDASNKFIALFYADFYSRESKQNGAWMTEYLAQSNMDGCELRPHISICCNFSKPTETTPALLTFNELTTLLHEFGHALHGMLANTVYPSLSGTNVYRDFVELPSQIMENWATETEWLRTFARHYETGEVIPAHLIEKLVASRNFQAGYQSERQLSFAKCDMAWHSLNHEFRSDIKTFENDATSEMQLFPNIEGSCISTSFSHIFGGGYASGYYGYKWAEVLDADAFSVFKAKGIFDIETATRFRKTILEKGGTVDPNILYTKFKGNEPGINALLERSGLR